MSNAKPRAPSHLSDSSKRWFKSVVGEYQLEPHHVRILALAAEAWDRCGQARKVLDRKGLTFETSEGIPRVRPEVAVERDSRLAFARLVRELALDVAAPDSRPPRTGGQSY